MVVVRLIGGLGNQLFQYAAARAISQRLQTEVKIDISPYDKYKLHKYALNYFDIIADIVTQDELLGLTIKKEKQFHFDSNICQYSDDIYIEGYWQTEKYFFLISEMLHKELSVSTALDGKDKKMAILIEKYNSVSLHIRRGDYVKETYNDQIFDTCDFSYYKKAIERIVATVESPHFFIFSDDHNWVEKNLSLEYPVTFVDHNDASTNYQDLRLMSLCKHNIIANSSFSWWGAWLNNNTDKIVCAPKKWFNDNAKNIDSRDLVPDSWVRL